MHPAHARGALLGLAVGDALGTTLEFRELDAPPFPTRCTGPHVDVTGGGPFAVAPGQVTDDTQLAVCLAESLRANGGFSLEDVARRYLAWGAHAFDVGSQTAAALSALRRGARPEDAGRLVWEARGRQPAGNGSLMRTAPLGVYFADDLPALRAAARAESSLTHFDPRCVEACVAFDAAIACAVRTQTPSPRAMLAAAQAELTEPALREDLALAQQDDPQLSGPQVHLHEHQGFVRVAFRLAFWELLHAPSFEAALVDVVNRGGDADTNGAITGALLGAALGVDAIPRRWRDAVLHASPPPPWDDAYHPRRLLLLAPEA